MQKPLKKLAAISLFGPRGGKLHSGVDYYAPTGTEVYASEDGVVVRASFHEGYGNVIVIDHGVVGGLRTYSLYAHLGSMEVNPGQAVRAGKKIGFSGHTGRVESAFGGDGSHLHYEVIQSRDRSPLPWNKEGGMGVAGYRVDPEMFIDEEHPIAPVYSGPRQAAKDSAKRINAISGRGVPPVRSNSPALKRLSKVISIIGGETLRREGDHAWRIEKDGSTRGYFISA